MSRLTRAVLILGLAIALGGAIFLYTWDIPAPQERVQKTLSNDRFAN